MTPRRQPAAHLLRRLILTKKLFIPVISVLFFANYAAAQPSVTKNGVLNAASYSIVGLPNSSIAQGSMFIVFGTKLGATSDLSTLSFPLPTTLLGTSVKVTVGSTSVDAIM